MSRARISLATTLVSLEIPKSRMLARLEPLTSESLGYRLGPASWNALEVLDHVIRTEIGVLRMMRSNASRVESVSPFDRIKGKMVLAVMLLPTRVSVPPAVSHLHPTGDTLELAELKAKWADARVALREFIDSLPEKTLSAGVCRHPVGGWMTPRDTLRFLKAHLHHHGYQLARLSQGHATSVAPLPAAR